jgi:hypothetical protein
MGRVLAMLATATVVVVGGCGVKSYEIRLDKTLEDMRYQDRLNKMLIAPQNTGKWQQYSIYLRAPRENVPAKGWLLVPIEPGKFDLEASFTETTKDTTKQFLHVLARVKVPKKAAVPAKKGTNPAAATPPVERKDFYTDVLDVLAKSYPTVPPEDFVVSKFKPATEKNNDFKRHVFAANGMNTEVYFYKKDPYEVVLVYGYPKTEMTHFNKVKLSLESFAVGELAKRLFSGATGSEAEQGAKAAPSAF